MLARTGALVLQGILVSRGVAIGLRNIGFWIEVCEDCQCRRLAIWQSKKLTLWRNVNKLFKFARAVATFVWRHVCNIF